MAPAPQPPHAGLPARFDYQRQRPEQTTIYQVVAEELETFLAEVEAHMGACAPAFAKDEFEAFLKCGILAHGFPRLRCCACGHEKLVAFSCKRRGFYPSCGVRRMAEKPSEQACEHARRPARMSWARLLKRVFDIDVGHCACGGKLKIIAAIEEPTVIERILTYLGLSAQAPPRTPARRVKPAADSPRVILSPAAQRPRIDTQLRGWFGCRRFRPPAQGGGWRLLGHWNRPRRERLATGPHRVSDAGHPGLCARHRRCTKQFAGVPRCLTSRSGR